MTPRHLYIHVPFCTRRCSYCNFAVQAAETPPVDAWLAVTLRELDLRMEREGWSGGSLATLYVGGGTPSTLGTGVLGRLRSGLEDRMALRADAEWTVEANPESFDRDLAVDWARVGVNRVSLGAQSFHGPALRWMGRLHGPDGPARAVAAARSARIDNVSVDLVFGLPEESGRDWTDDLDRALALEPEHVSLYGLTAEADAPLGRWVRQGRARLPDEDAYGAQYLEAVDRLTGAGLEHYEVSNFARFGKASRHNSAYWDGVDYLGLGVGAHSFAGGVRWWNDGDWTAYRTAVGEARLPEAGRERVDAATRRLERIWLGLRTRAGLVMDGLEPCQRELVTSWSDRGWAAMEGGTVRLTGPGWLLLDRLAVELDGAGSGPGIA